MLHLPSATCYGILSSIIVFANKYLLDYWTFNYPVILALIQVILTIIVILLLKKDLFAELYFHRIFENKIYLFTAFFHSLYLITSLKALKGVNIPIYAAFKRCNPIFCIVVSFFMFKKKQPSYYEINSSKRVLNNIFISTLAFGVVLAGIGDLKFDSFSYLYCGASVMSQSFYFSLIQKCAETSTDYIRTLGITNLYSLPILLNCLFLFNEHIDVIDFINGPYFINRNFWFYAIFVVVIGCLLSFSQMSCTTNNNAIVTSFIGVLKSFIHSAFGLFFFQAYQNMTSLAIFGIFLNLIFGSWYSFVKYKESAYSELRSLDDLHSHF